MGGGGYNGGLTLIGLGLPWSFEPHSIFRDSSVPSGKPKRKRGTPLPTEPVVIAGDLPIDNGVSHMQRLAVDRKIDRNTVLVATGCRLRQKAVERREALKRLVIDRVSLQTGVSNIDHPALAAWIITDRKATDQHG